MRTYLNLGCGGRFHPDWTNIDLVASGPGVIAHDLSQGVPGPDGRAEVVYHTAVLEHLRPADALAFLRECHRVLKPGGLIRVGVPDLEGICRLYLEKLAAAVDNQPGAAADYDWLTLELLDQMVRERSGGEMLAYLRQNPLPNERFIQTRIGSEARAIIASLRSTPPGTPRPAAGEGGFIRVAARRLRAALLSLLAGPDAARAIAIGRFRLGGEAHQWMYDRFSLARLLRAAGFEQPVPRTAGASAIPDWTRFNLDTDREGTVNKPDLIFMEARKAERTTDG